MIGFFKGNGATLLKIVPFSAIEFYAYEVFKNNLYPDKKANEFTYAQKLFCGGLTGIAAQTFSYPLDVIKTYLSINIENN